MDRNQSRNFGIDELRSLMPTKFSSCLVPSIVIVDGFSMLAFGLFYLLLSGMTDPIGNLEIKDELIRQGVIVALLALVYIFVCLISLVYWHFRKDYWNYVVLSLGLLHLGVFTFLLTFRNEFNSLIFLFCFSLVGNLLLAASILFGIIKSKAFIQKSRV